MLRNLTILLLFCGTTAWAQESTSTAVNDPGTISLLNQALTVAGGTKLLASIEDLTAIGEITFYFAGEETKGVATIWARGADQFRLDANLPDGMRSVVYHRMEGALKEPDGTVRQIPPHNTINLGILSFPQLNLLASLSASATEVSFIGMSTVNERNAYQIKIQRHFSKEFDSIGWITKLCNVDFFIDAATGLILKTQDMTHPDYTLTEDLSHEIEFDDYVAVKGINLPSLIREKILGQTIWEVRLMAISFDNGLSDLDFSLSQ
jgi:hypothetical protein